VDLASYYLPLHAYSFMTDSEFSTVTLNRLI
jgi:hypothetical protein